MSNFRPPAWKIALAKRLGFDYECLGSGNGAYWAWSGYFRLGRWSFRIERFIRMEYDWK